MWSRANNIVMIRKKWTTCWLPIDGDLSISNKSITHIYRCRCWMWMATVRGLREHRLLLHCWRAPWRPSRVCLQARRKGKWNHRRTVFCLPRSRLSTVKTFTCVLAGYLGWYDWRNLHADGHFAVGHLENRLEQRGSHYWNWQKKDIFFFIFILYRVPMIHNYKL